MKEQTNGNALETVQPHAQKHVQEQQICLSIETEKGYSKEVVIANI